MDMWRQFGVAIALLFVIEGIIPFLSPSRWRNLVQVMAHMDDRTMRAMGLFSMLFGVVLLYLIN